MVWSSWTTSTLEDFTFEPSNLWMYVCVYVWTNRPPSLPSSLPPSHTYSMCWLIATPPFSRHLKTVDGDDGDSDGGSDDGWRPLPRVRSQLPLIIRHWPCSVDLCSFLPLCLILSIFLPLFLLTFFSLVSYLQSFFSFVLFRYGFIYIHWLTYTEWHTDSSSSNLNTHICHIIFGSSIHSAKHKLTNIHIEFATLASTHHQFHHNSFEQISSYKFSTNKLSFRVFRFLFVRFCSNSSLISNLFNHHFTFVWFHLHPSAFVRLLSLLYTQLD